MKNSHLYTIASILFLLACDDFRFLTNVSPRDTVDEENLAVVAYITMNGDETSSNNNTITLNPKSKALIEKLRDSKTQKDLLAIIDDTIANTEGILLEIVKDNGDNEINAIAQSLRDNIHQVTDEKGKQKIPKLVEVLNTSVEGMQGEEQKRAKKIVNAIRIGQIESILKSTTLLNGVVENLQQNLDMLKEDEPNKDQDEALKALENRIKEEVEKKAREEKRIAKEETERIAREKADRLAREEAERQAKEEAERQAKEEAERVAKEEAERQAREAAYKQKLYKAIKLAQQKVQKEGEEKCPIYCKFHIDDICTALEGLKNPGGSNAAISSTGIDEKKGAAQQFVHDQYKSFYDKLKSIASDYLDTDSFRNAFFGQCVKGASSEEDFKSRKKALMKVVTIAKGFSKKSEREQNAITNKKELTYEDIISARETIRKAQEAGNDSRYSSSNFKEILKLIYENGSAKNTVARWEREEKKPSKFLGIKTEKGTTAVDNASAPIILVAIMVTEDMGNLFDLIKSLHLLGADIKKEGGRTGNENNAHYWLNKVHGDGTGAIDKRGNQYNKIVAYLTACGVPAL